MDYYTSEIFAAAPPLSQHIVHSFNPLGPIIRVFDLLNVWGGWEAISYRPEF
jgi:hypothetical protein